MKYTIVKIGRAQYQLQDESGNNMFSYPTSKNDCQQFINGTKADEKFLSDPRMQQVAKGYINETKLPVSQYGDIHQFMVNSIYNMLPRYIREIQRRKEWYRDHLYKVAATNKAARLANTLNTNDTPEIKKESALEIAHGLVHDISFNVREGNIIEAQKLLTELDMLLHDEIHLQGKV